MSSPPGLLLALGGGLLLGWATPPAVVPFGEWLVLPALAIWFAIATEGRRPLLHSYLLGCVHMAWFSWSVRHVMVPAYVAIVVLGGLYYVMATACVRGAPARLRGVAFAFAVAGSFWLRAVMPEIHYPHGQPCHCLYQWPAVMRVVVLGGEPLLNGLLAWLAACGWGAWSSWRVAVPSWAGARSRFAIAAAALVGCVVVGNVVVARERASGASEPPRRPLTVAAVEPGYHPEQLFEQPRSQWRAWSERMLEQRMLAPTRAALGAEQAPDLVVWPESSVNALVDAAQIEREAATLLPQRLPASDARLLLGANVRRPAGATPAALLLRLPDGRVLDYQGKQRLVPGGEFLPLLSVLPESWSGWVKEQFRQALGTLPECVGGEPRRPMLTAAGTPFGALLCYDNAFPGPAAVQVAQGARALVVLSNEAWYRGGAELSQLVAMTVVRACENVVPVVRCTMDGWSVSVDAAGALSAQLPLSEGGGSESRMLLARVDPGSGKPPPMQWLRQSSGWLSGLLMAVGILAGMRRSRGARDRATGGSQAVS